MIETIIIIFGLTLGSFTNNLISYFSNKSGFDFFRSSCFCGEKTLTVTELLPLINYLILRGKCKACRKPIPIRYPVIELLSVLIAFLTYLQYNISLLFFVNFFIYLTLLIIAAVDYYSYRIPNLLVFILLLLSVIKFTIFPVNIELKIVSAVLTVSIFVIINLSTQKLLKKETIGYGDIKLIGVSFLLLDFPLQFVWLWFSALIAIPGFYLLKFFNQKYKMEKRIPFGVFMSFTFILIKFNEGKIIENFWKFINR